ncbi:hypothetical protein I7I51_03141 [Histoplasma capsulatum]|uniref:Uncharacterized protein n=1 Tax=Ajellomyces capsulatus TaxID=5037 RepID=A0A8A1MM66_AJECA|nr:hypothetical protein I7I51_03141 [Histoplasma capsulatum]
MADNKPLKTYHAYRSSDFKTSRLQLFGFAPATRIDPPQNSVAVVVDVVESQGAIRIFERKDDSYVNGVGTEEAGHMVIVPWNSGWWFRVSGSIRVGYAVANNVK